MGFPNNRSTTSKLQGQSRRYKPRMRIRIVISTGPAHLRTGNVDVHNVKAATLVAKLLYLEGHRHSVSGSILGLIIVAIWVLVAYLLSPPEYPTSSCPMMVSCSSCKTAQGRDILSRELPRSVVPCFGGVFLLKEILNIWGLPKFRGTFWGVPAIRTIVYWGLN